MVPELVIGLTKFTMFPLKDILHSHRTSLIMTALGVVLADEKLWLSFGNWKLCLAESVLERGSRSLAGGELPCPFAWQILFWKTSLPLLFEFPPRNHHLRITVAELILYWPESLGLCLSTYTAREKMFHLLPNSWLTLSYRHVGAHTKAAMPRKKKKYPLQNHILQTLLRKLFGTSTEFHLKTPNWKFTECIQTQKMRGTPTFVCLFLETVFKIRAV